MQAPKGLHKAAPKCWVGVRIGGPACCFRAPEESKVTWWPGPGRLGRFPFRLNPRI